MIARLGHQGTLKLLHLISIALNTGELPIAWNHANIGPISKASDLNSSRPTSPLSCLGKAMERIILARLKYKILQRHPHFFAFSEELGTADGTASVKYSLDKRRAVLIILDQ